MDMKKQILARTELSAKLLNALVNDDYQVLNGLISPFSEQALQRSSTASVDKNYMILSTSQYLVLKTSPAILFQRLFAYLENTGTLDTNTFNNTEK